MPDSVVAVAIHPIARPVHGMGAIMRQRAASGASVYVFER